MERSIPLSVEKKAKTYLNLGLLMAVVLFCFLYLNVNVGDIVTALPNLVGFLVDNFMPPNFTNLGVYMGAVMDTILFAIVGTYISAFLAFTFGILMSEAMMPNPWVRGLVRFFISFLRNIPVLIWASLLIFVFGIGNMVGLIALILATVGFLSRSYAESINEIAGSKLESLRASGAGWWQILFHGLIPEFIPSWMNWTLFSFEINIRASAILGTVGAGGLGILIQTNLNMRNFTEAAALIVILVAMVLLTEAAVSLLRKRLSIGGH
ncbi:MAG: phosphonate ABC transporter, permease protein PhnE [Turicibacter sp.]|nr:phosphonate ABC transporter, permease protein PhnE [Turicibacter sp.]